jgi:hypothetical protein
MAELGLVAVGGDELVREEAIGVVVERVPVEIAGLRAPSDGVRPMLRDRGSPPGPLADAPRR